jgi:hypothetical protein
MRFVVLAILALLAGAARAQEPTASPTPTPTPTPAARVDHVFPAYRGFAVRIENAPTTHTYTVRTTDLATSAVRTTASAAPNAAGIVSIRVNNLALDARPYWVEVVETAGAQSAVLGSALRRTLDVLTLLPEGFTNKLEAAFADFTPVQRAAVYSRLRQATLKYVNERRALNIEAEQAQMLPETP